MRKLWKLALLPICWLVYGLSFLSRRDRELVVFGVQSRSFSGNVKALLLAESPGIEKIFIAPSWSQITEIRDHGARCEWKYSPSGIFHCLRAGTFLYSNYPSDINFWLSGGAKFINVWHGTPLKNIEQDVSRGPYSRRNRWKRLYAALAPYLVAKPHTLIASSRYEEHRFTSAFDIESESFFRCFPPRLELKIRTEKSGRTRVLYAPTWRDDHSFKLADHIDFEELSKFACSNKIEFFIKLHPSDNQDTPLIELPGIQFIAPYHDVYDLLASMDIVLTDYSSMLFEGLYLGIDVVLFSPDAEDFTARSRDFYIDPCAELGLERCDNQAEFLDRIVERRDWAAAKLELPALFLPYPRRSKLLRALRDHAYNDRKSDG